MAAGGFERVAVVGAGTMGNGIAQVFATYGHDVVLVDVNEEALAKGLVYDQTSFVKIDFELADVLCFQQ